MKPIILNFHKEDMFQELLETMQKSSAKHGEDKFKVIETDNEIIVEVIDRV